MKTYMLGFTKEGEALLHNRFEHLGPITQDTLRRILQNDTVCQSASLAKGDYLYMWYGEYSALWQALGEVLEPVPIHPASMQDGSAATSTATSAGLT